MTGALDVARLKDCLQNIVDRHEILRTTFQRSAGMVFPFQVVSPAAPLSWNHADVRSLRAADRSARITALLQEMPRLDLASSSLSCVHLLRLADEEHVLLLGCARACADRETAANIVRELAVLYASVEPPREVLQYADYSDWQNELLHQQDQKSAEAAEYWARQNVPSPELPFAGRPAGGTFVQAQVPVPVDPSVSSAFAHPLPAFLAAWYVLVCRYTGRTEVPISWMSNGRAHDEFRSAMGPFARRLPLVAGFAEDMPFSAAVDCVDRLQAESAEWQDYFSFSSVPSGLQVGFCAEEDWPELNSGRVTFSIHSYTETAAGYQALLRVRRRNGLWVAELAYDPQCLAMETAKRMARSLAVLLEAAAADPGASVGSLPILAGSDLRLVTHTFNQTAVSYPQGQCIHTMFEEQAARFYHRPALRFRTQVLSYAELNADANRIAHFLRRRGVGPNVVVGLHAERSAEMIVGMLGILKAGGCYLPLTPGDPKSRLAHQLSETRAPLVLTQEKLAGGLPEFDGEIVCLERDFSTEPASNPEPRNLPDHLVYVIYTSGSTGVPKGVAVAHSNLVNYSRFLCERLGVEQHPEGLDFATVSTMSADLGNTSIFPSLISGGCLHVIDYETAMAANLFAAYVAAHPIDVLKITPSQLSTLLRGARNQPVLPREYLLLGGERFSWELLDRIHESGACTVLNHYGPTETTVGCCTFIAERNSVSEWMPATVPIGRPIANAEVYLLDTRLRPVPPGVAGELCIGGAGLARGYLNQPEQTAERFIPHPFSSHPGARLYRTGDLARFLPDGNIEFLGRIDQQVKIRGYRVELAEIESCLARHSGVKQAVVSTQEDHSGDRMIAAYVVADRPLRPDTLRAFLRQALPEHMIPARLVLLDSLPLTANGKVDMRALSAYAQESGQVERPYIAPRNPDEERLAAIWQEVLALDRVSMDDNFFELGGHSLLATQIISRIRNVFQVQFPLAAFLETPTIAQIAPRIPECPIVESEEEEMARLLAQLEAISDEEAGLLLENVEKAKSEGA